MSRKNFIFLIIIAVTIGAVIVLWQSGVFTRKPSIDREVVKIGMIGPLTGGAAQYGVEARNGVQLAIFRLNQKQGPYRYELISLDSEANPDIAKEKAQELALNKEILAVVGPIISPSVVSANEVFQQEGLPAVSPSATSPKISLLGDFVFRVSPSDTYQGRALAEFVSLDLGFNKVAIFSDLENASYSGELADSFTERAEQLAVVITKRTTYRAGQKEFTSSLQEIQASEPEVLFIPGYYADGALIAQQARAMGWYIPIIGGDGFHTPDLIEIGGMSVDGVRFTSFFSADDPDPMVQDFVSSYRARYGEEPGWIDAHGYDAMNVIAKAIETGGTSRQGVQKALSDTRGFQGITGVISFDENGDVIKDILKMEVKEGKFRVWSL
ncbi:MAG: ABC transporter substrate-binding protein [Patescibacteria group bacterium]|nr:ABC transporter substrate-binding protein [Patescibacteria group bacterium]